MPFLLFVMVLFFSGMFGSVAQAMGSLIEPSGSVIGQSAPDFTLDTLAKEQLNFTQYRNGKPALLFFWATWCPHCRTQLRELNARRSEIEGQGVQILLIDTGESKGQVQAYVERNEISLDVFLDKHSTVSNAYGVNGVPTIFLIDKNGVVQTVTHGLPENFDVIVK